MRFLLTLAIAIGIIMCAILPVWAFEGEKTSINDNEGESSREKVAPPISVLSLIASTGGSVRPAYNGSALQIGKSYTLLAKPLLGYAFSNWTGIISNNSNPLTFVMQSNMLLQANFTLVNPFPVLAGVYDGLFFPSNSVSASNSGYVSITLAASGSFEGNLVSGSKTRTFQARFDNSGNAEVSLAGTPSLALTLALDLNNQAISGQVSNANWIASLQSYRGVATTNLAGSYTVLIGGSSNASSGPVGFGAASLNLSKEGAATISGALADGTTFSEAASVGSASAMPFYVSTFNGMGMAIGWLQLGSQSSLYWSRPPLENSSLYGAGFSVAPQVVVSKFTPPAANEPIVDWTNGTISLSGGDLPQALTEEISVHNDSIQGKGGALKNLQIQIARKTGIISGSFVSPVTGKIAAFSGAILQDPGGVYPVHSGGWFLGTNAGGWLQIDPILSVPIAEPASDVAAIGFTANWQPMPAADGFRVDVSSNTDFSTFVLQNQVATGSNFNVTGLVPGTTYYYRVSAVGAGQTTASSTVESVATLTPVPVATATIGSASGAITAPSNSPLAGVVLQVPAGAYSNRLNFIMSSSPVGSANIPNGLSPLTSLIVIDNGGIQANDIMTVTVPMSVPSNQLVIGMIYNPSDGSWEAAPTITSSNSISVLTRHFSYLVIAERALNAFTGDLTAANLDSGFLPSVDGWEFTNTGSFLSPGGDCEGMSQSAMWYYINMKQTVGPLFNQYNNSLYNFRTPAVPDDDILGRSLVAELQAQTGTWLNTLSKSLTSVVQSQKDAFFCCGLALAVFREPQFFRIVGPRGGHIIVARKIDQGGIYVYDPNYPADSTRKIPWNSVTQSFGTYDDFTEFYYLGKSVLSEWSSIPNLWSKLDNKTIGMGDFPVFKVAANEELDSSWVEAGSVLSTQPSQTPIKVHSPNAQAWAYVESGDVSTLSWSVYSPEGVPYDPTIPLTPGTNLLGVEIKANGGWAGFAWLTVNSELDAPAALPATGQTTNGFTADWTAVNGALSYQIDISTNSQFDNFITNNASVAATTIVTNDNSGVIVSETYWGAAFASDQTYYYRVRAVSGSLVSSNSNVIPVTPAPLQWTSTNDVWTDSQLANYSIGGYYILWWDPGPVSWSGNPYVEAKGLNGQPASISSTNGSVDSSINCSFSSTGLTDDGEISSTGPLLVYEASTDVLNTYGAAAFTAALQTAETNQLNLTFSWNGSYEATNWVNAGVVPQAVFTCDHEYWTFSDLLIGAGRTNLSLTLNPGTHTLSYEVQVAAAAANSPSSDAGESFDIPISTNSGMVSYDLTFSMLASFTPTQASVAKNVEMLADFTPIVLTAKILGRNLALTWPAIAGQKYQVQYATNLPAGTWRNLGAPLAAPDRSLNVVDINTLDAERFYRVVSQTMPSFSSVESTGNAVAPPSQLIRNASLGPSRSSKKVTTGE